MSIGVGRTAKDAGIYLVNQATSQMVTMSLEVAEQVANHIATNVVGYRDGELETFGPFAIKRDGDDFVFMRAGVRTVFTVLTQWQAMKVSQRIRDSIAISQRNRRPELLPAGMSESRRGDEVN